MANVSKIKLPDNTTRDIVDSRISSVDSTISSSSTGVVQNNAIAAEFAKVAYIGTGIDSATYSDGGIVVDISNKADKVTGATSGNFASLDSNGNLADSGHKHSDYQAALVSGTNIKTINNESLLGFGNITVSSGNSGTVTSVGMTVPTGLSVSGSPVTTSGTLVVSLASGYSIPTTSKQSEWDGKQAALVSGTNIKTVNNQSLLGSGNLNVSEAKVYVVESTYAQWDGGSFTITTQMFDSMVDDAENGRSVVLRFHIIDSAEGYNEVFDYALTFSSSSNNYWSLQFNRLHNATSGYVLYLSKEGSTVNHRFYDYSYELVGNRSTSISSTSSNSTYPTSKAVYNAIQDARRNLIYTSFNVTGWSDISSGNYSVPTTTFNNFVSYYREGTVYGIVFRNSSGTTSITFRQVFVCAGYENSTLYFTNADNGHLYTITWQIVNSTVQKTFTDNSIDGLPAVSTWGQFLVSGWDNTSSSYKWKVSPDLYFNSASALQVDGSGGVLSPLFNTKSGPQGEGSWIQIDSRGLIGETYRNQSVYSDWSWIKYRSSYSPSAYVTLQDTLDSIGLPPVTSADYGKMLWVDYDSTNGYHWSKNAPFHYESHFLSGDAIWGISLFDTGDGNITFDAGNSSNGVIRYWMNTYLSQQYKNWNWIRYTFYDSTEQTRFEVSLQDTLDTKQDLLVSGTNIKTINNQSLLGSGNITISGGGDTSTCVHLTGDETISDDKTFTDNIAVVDASHILYSGASPSQGFTRAYAVVNTLTSSNTITFTGLSGEPKAFVIADSYYALPGASTAAVLGIVGDSTGCHGVYTTGTQHNYSSGFTASYSNGSLTVTAPTGVVFCADAWYGITYYYGDGTLTFKTSQIQPGSGVTAVTFTGNGLTEVPAMYACFLESAVNSESYRRVALYTNSLAEYDADEITSEGLTFYSSQIANTTSSFSVSYNNGLYINSGGTNAGGYFHNPGTYTLYYLMASDIGGGSGSYSSLADELGAINTTIGNIETILASI